jgi:hypothetical protein
MKKYLILPAMFIIAGTSLRPSIASANIIKTITCHQPDSLAVYTGKYQMQQGQQIIYMEVYIQNGKLAGKDLSNGGIKILDHISGDDFILSKEKAAIKFVRNKDQRVTQIAIMGNVMWTKVDSNSTALGSEQPAALWDYTGKYQATVNGQNMVIGIFLKNGQLIATQLWDGANSNLDYVSGDSFIVAALSMPMKFIRGNNKAVTQLVLNGADVFKKINVER